MQIRFTRALGLAALITLLPACGGPKSSSTGGAEGEPVATNRMTIYLTVESSDAQTAVVRANLNDGKVFGESYRLDGGDFLRACLNGVCRTMADNDSVFTPDYIARFDYRPGIDYVVSFNRRKARSAPDSRVTLPPAFTIVTPANRQQVSDGETVQVEWSPSGAPARVGMRFDAECHYLSGPQSFLTGTLGSDTNADGREPFRVDEIVDLARSNAPSRITRCNIEVTVSHEIQGRIDPAFDDGFATGIVSRKVSLDYFPR
jgi:hypothetical protein